jgi:hypothetical protein
MAIFNSVRIISWELFLVCLIISVGIPAMSLYDTSEVTSSDVYGELLAKFILSGFPVIITFEYFCLRFATAQPEIPKTNHLAISISIPLTYYIVSGLGAHSNISLQLSFYIAWLLILYLIGRNFKSRLKEQEILKPIAIFSFAGTAILAATNLAWTFIYAELLRPNRLELTPYFMIGVATLDCALLFGLLSYTKKISSHKSSKGNCSEK